MTRNRLIWLLPWLCVACAGPAPNPPAYCSSDCAVVDIINHGWHSGLVLRVTDIPRGLLPEAADFPGSDHLEFGWGDGDYYQADDPGPWLTLKAACWPTSSVLHVVGFSGSVNRQFAGYESVRLELTRERFLGLAVFVDQGFDRQGKAKAGPLRPGYGLNSRFYPARGTFHLFNTCNGWIAQALAAAGYPMGAPDPVTADALMTRVRAGVPHAESGAPRAR